jgi:hypothetical protein
MFSESGLWVVVSVGYQPKTLTNEIKGFAMKKVSTAKAISLTHLKQQLGIKATKIFRFLFLWLVFAPVSLAHADAIEGYLSAFSVKPGNSLSLYTSTTLSKFDLKIYQVKSTNELVATYEDIPGKWYETPDNVWVDGAGWQDPYSFTIGDDWVSGIYLVKIEAGNASKTLNFVVKADKPGTASGILHLDNASTVMAYNNWGGKSLYNYNSTDKVAATSVTRYRPNQNGSSIKEIEFAKWADKMDIKLEHASILDLHENAQLLDNYQVVVVTGHRA